MGSCMIAVTQTNKENGCLQVLRGSHKIGLLQHHRIDGQATHDADRIAAGETRLPLEYVEMAPGDALFFHCNLLHRSSQNQSANPRWSLICCFNASSNPPFQSGGHHPDYSPIQVLKDSELLEVGRQELRQPAVARL